MTEIQMVAGLIFTLTFLLIVTEMIHRTLSAIVGAGLMVFYGIIPYDKMFGFIDFETIGIILGMMLIVEVVSTTGLFQLIAIKAAKRAKGDPTKLFVFFMALTTVFSAFLTDAATMLIMASITIMIARITKMNPAPFLIYEVIFTNVGGLTTLISSVPCILVGTEANLSFVDFLVNLGPLVLILFGATIFMVISKGGFQRISNAEELFEMDEWSAVTDRRLFWRSLFVLAATITAFAFGSSLGLPPVIVALGGGTAMLLLSGVSPEKTLREIDWSTIFFFAGIFVVLGGVERIGIFLEIASLVRLVGVNPVVAGVSVLWFSSFASVAVHNIVITATLIPILRDLVTTLGRGAEVLWWTLVAGATLGGNIIPIGSVAGVIALGVSEREGYAISMGEFIKLGALMALIQIGLATAYFYVRYLGPLTP